MPVSVIFFPEKRRSPKWVSGVLFCAVLTVVLAGMLLTLREIDHRQDLSVIRMEQFRVLPPGEYLKPILLGYQNIAADVLWLRMIQVLGERKVSAQDYEWLYHALDVITTLDPQYTYAYQIGGIVLAELAHRVDLSDQILQKGVAHNPTYWYLPFYLGFNHFFHLQDYPAAAEYMARASQLPGHPAFVPPLAARLYAQAGSPETALDFLEIMWRETKDERVKESLQGRMKEVLIERDIQLLEEGVANYMEHFGKRPGSLSDLVNRGVLVALPQEPFGGVYNFDARMGVITSSTHPERLRVYRPR